MRFVKKLPTTLCENGQDILDASEDRATEFRHSGVKEEDFLAHKLAQNNH